MPTGDAVALACLFGEGGARASLEWREVVTVVAVRSCVAQPFAQLERLSEGVGGEQALA